MDTTDMMVTDRADQADEPAEGTLRRCIATREVLPKARLIRFVIGPEGEVVPDAEGKLPGRGLWVKADRAALETAIARNLFAKAGRRSATIPVDLADRVVELLKRRCLNLIGLARRAGQAVAGFERVRAELARQNVGVLLAAIDGADDGKRKLRARADGVPTIALFTNAELSTVLGRENVVHAALTQGRFAEILIAETCRLAGLRGTSE